MSQVEFLVKLRDGLQMAVDSIEEYLEKISPADRPAWDPEKIAWSPDEGPKGPYERSEDVNNLQFKAMLKDLGQHDGKLYRDRWFYWVFDNGVTVGRKYKGSEKTPDEAGSNPTRGSNPHARMQSNLENLKKAGEVLT